MSQHKKISQNKKEKKLIWKAVGIIFAIFMIFGFILFSIVQAVYYDYNAPSDYTQTRTENINLYNGNSVLLNPTSDEVWEFDLYLISTGERLEGGLVQGSAHSVGCWWGDETDTNYDCSLNIRIFHAPIYAYEGQSCSEDWEFCRTGDDTTCVSGVCVANPECSIDSECSDGGYIGSNYCFSGNVVRDFNEANCNLGECGFNIVKKDITTCDNGCDNGACLDADAIIPTCTDGETRYSGDTIFICDVQTPIQEICSAGVWNVVVAPNVCDTSIIPEGEIECGIGDSKVFTYDLDCEGNIGTTRVYCSNGAWAYPTLEPLNCSIFEDVDWVAIIITILVAGAIIGVVIFLKNNDKPIIGKKQ